MFIRTRTINGRTYKSLEERRWCPVTKKVKSRYLKKINLFGVDWHATIMGDQMKGPSEEELLKEVERKEQAEREAKAKEWTQEKFLRDTHKEEPKGAQDAGEGDKSEGGEVKQG